MLLPRRLSVPGADFRRLKACFALGFLLSGLTACSPPAEPDSGQPDISNIMGNLDYRLEYLDGAPVQLASGEFSISLVPESATVLRVKLLDAAAGDLDGDGSRDGAAVLASSPGGSGTFYDLVVALNTASGWQHGATEFLGDRIRVDELTVSDGIITVGGRTRSSNTPMTVLDAEFRQRFRYQDGSLVPVSSPEE